MAEQAKAERRRKSVRRGITFVVIAAVAIGGIYLISRKSPAKPPTAQERANARAVAAGCPANPATRVNTLTWTKPPPMTISMTKKYTATIRTTTGTFTVLLNQTAAPQTVNSFVFLANKGFFKCVIFHRVISNFMDQTGDPTGTGTGGPGYTLPDEYPPKASNPAKQYPLGSLAMANTGQPHTSNSQFFIIAGPVGESLPNTYSLFGQVLSGMNVVEQINRQGSAKGVPPDVTQRMLSVTIHQS